MSANNKISTLIESQVPDFVLEEGPKFVAFIKKYYEWMEQRGQTIFEAKSLLEYADIDTTKEPYLSHIKEELFQQFPDDLEVDKKLFAKKIRDIYRAKGTERGYEALFRALFNTEVSLYYPGDFILKTDDGRWVKDTTIRVTNLTADSSEFLGRIITGQTSGATARVQRIEQTTEFGVDIYELFLENVNGDFEDTENVVAESNTITASIFSDTGSISEIILEYPGVGHNSGDLVNIIAVSGSGATGSIRGTTDQSLITFEIVNGGSGYTTNATITLTDGSGQDANFTITSISNTEVLPVYTDTIEAFANVVLNTGPTFVSAGANSASVSANLAAANVSSTLGSALGTSNVTVGTINSISVLDNGFGYSTLPTVSVIEEQIAIQLISDNEGNFKGNNAIIVANTLPGAITTISVISGGQSYSKFELVTIVNQTSANTTNATGFPIVSGFNTYPGRYIDTKGWIDWDHRFIDDNFYQEYSYVIKSEKDIGDYREDVLNTLHPVGRKLFGEVDIHTEIEAIDSDIESSEFEIFFTTELDTDVSGLATMSSNTTQYLPANGTISISSNNQVSISTDMIFDDSYDYRINGLGELISIMIVDNNSVYSNGLYIVTEVQSNTLLTISPDYPASSLANGTIYYVGANTVNYNWGPVSLAANNYLNYGSVTIAANNFINYGSVV